MQTVDLLIIGSGPAGISTALHLLQKDPGWSQRMLLIEKAAHPRPKLCGGGITRLGLGVLEDLGFNLPLPLPQAQVEDVRLTYGRRTVHVRGQPQFVVFHRAELDAYLAQQARQRGVSIQENEAVESLVVDDSGVTIRTAQGKYHAQAAVGADGSKGIARRAVSAPGVKSRVARLLEVVHPAQETAPNFIEHFARFDFTPVREELQGYFWDFPARVGGRACFNRGVYDARCAPTRPRARLPRLLDTALRSLAVEPESVEVEGHPIHWFSPRNRFSRPCLVLAGDAAGADPLLGEGIGPALGYGRVAAEAVHQAFARNDFSFADYRRRILLSPVGRYLLFRWCIAQGVYRLSDKPWFMHTFWSLGAALAALWPRPRPLYGPSAWRRVPGDEQSL
jgi:flavin-dependent dehydrogenase